MAGAFFSQLRVAIYLFFALLVLILRFGGGFADGACGLCSSPFEKSVLMMRI